MASAQGRHPRRRLLRAFALSRKVLRGTASPELVMWSRSILERPENGAAFGAVDNPIRRMNLGFVTNFRYMHIYILTYSASCIDS